MEVKGEGEEGVGKCVEMLGEKRRAKGKGGVGG